jgi:hypothetical protein
MKSGDILLLTHQERGPIPCRLIWNLPQRKVWLVRDLTGRCKIINESMLRPCGTPRQLELGQGIETVRTTGVSIGELHRAFVELMFPIPLSNNSCRNLFDDYVLYILKERNEKLGQVRSGSGTRGIGAETAGTETEDNWQTSSGHSGNAQVGGNGSPESR